MWNLRYKFMCFFFVCLFVCLVGGSGRMWLLQDDSRPRFQKGMLKLFLAPYLSIASTITKGMRKWKALLEILSRPLPPENVSQVRNEMLLTLHYQLQARVRGETRKAKRPTRTKVLLHFLKWAVSGGHVIQKLLYWTRVTRSICSTTVTSKIVLLSHLCTFCRGNQWDSRQDKIVTPPF